MFPLYLIQNRITATNAHVSVASQVLNARTKWTGAPWVLPPTQSARTMHPVSTPFRRPCATASTATVAIAVASSAIRAPLNHALEAIVASWQPAQRMTTSASVQPASQVRTASRTSTSAWT